MAKTARRTLPMSIRPMGVDDFRASAVKLFADHWQEVAKNKQVMKLDPNWKGYYALEERGLLMCLGLFVGAELAGYSVNFVTQHLHYQALTYAQNDLLFVAPAWRASRFGLRLIHETEDHARRRGCKLMLWHAKDDARLTLKDLLPRLGYGVQDIIYSKEL